MKNLNELFRKFYCEYMDSLVINMWKEKLNSNHIDSRQAYRVLSNYYNDVYAIFIKSLNVDDFINQISLFIIQTKDCSQAKQILVLFVEYFKLEFETYCKDRLNKNCTTAKNQVKEVPKWQIELDKINKIIKGANK